jgi:CRP-like cAMP-binding protein
MQPIFIVGEQRSGSNLLRLMLSQAGVSAPHPPHLLTRLMPLVPSYGDLHQDSNWRRLIEDACQLVERNPVPWQSVEHFDRQAIEERCRERSLIAIFGAVMDTYAESQGADSWACKSMGCAKYGVELDQYFVSPKYLFLYRDGRDVTLSFTKAVVGEKHPYHIAKRWNEAQSVCLAEQERIPERYHRLCYEELTAEPEPILRRLCDFLKVPFTLAMLDFHRSNEAQATSGKSQLWQNLSRPVMRNNSKKFLTGLTEHQIRIVESVAGASLDALGYDRAFVQPNEELVFGAEELATFARQNAETKASRRAMMEEEDAKRREHQLDTLTQRVYFMTDFSREEALRFLSFVYEEHIPQGATIVEEGSTERDIFFIIEGTSAVFRGGEKVAELANGDCFGELNMFSGGVRTGTVRAQTDLRLFRLTWARLRGLRTDAPDLANKVLWAVSARLADRFRGAVV